MNVAIALALTCRGWQRRVARLRFALTPAVPECPADGREPHEPRPREGTTVRHAVDPPDSLTQRLNAIQYGKLP